MVETGSYLGHTSEAIGRALKAEGRGRLKTYEIHPERAAFVASRVSGLPVDVYAQDSRSFVLSGPGLDLLFVDSEYGARIEEIRLFKQFASPRCVIVAHDTVVESYRRALEGLAKEGVTTPWILLPTPRGLGLARYA